MWQLLRQRLHLTPSCLRIRLKGERSDATTHVPVPAGKNDADVLTDAFTDAHSSDDDIL